MPIVWHACLAQACLQAGAPTAATLAAATSATPAAIVPAAWLPDTRPCRRLLLTGPIQGIVEGLGHLNNPAVLGTYGCNSEALRTASRLPSYCCWHQNELEFCFKAGGAVFIARCPVHQE